MGAATEFGYSPVCGSATRTLPTSSGGSAPIRIGCKLPRGTSDVRVVRATYLDTVVTEQAPSNFNPLDVQWAERVLRGSQAHGEHFARFLDAALSDGRVMRACSGDSERVLSYRFYPNTFSDECVCFRYRGEERKCTLLDARFELVGWVRMLYRGNNQEDALVINKNTIAYKMFASLQFDGYSVAHSMPPDLDSQRKSKSQIDGTLPLLSVVAPGGVMANDASGPVRNGLRSQATVDSVVISEAAAIDQKHQAFVRTYQFRDPVCGDKFSSRHGQKGVIGMVVPAIELPYAEDGLQPDFLINAQAFPSRMSIGHLMEMMAGLEGIRLGKCLDGTPFDSRTLGEIQASLYSTNAHPRMMSVLPGGGTVMFDPQTGLPLPEPVFVAPCLYMRLHHNVMDKCMAQSSATGGLDAKTAQPLRGAARNGSLRVGEMEVDAFVAWGVAVGLLEKMLNQSDGSIAVFCKKCGLPALEVASQPGGGRGSTKRCPACAHEAMRSAQTYSPDVALVYMGRSSLFVVYSLLAMGIALRFRFGETQKA